MEISLENITQEQVWEALQSVGKLYHYLAHKPLEDWDEYDLGNYKSILNKYKTIK